MNFRRLLGRLLAIFVIAGLVTVPLVTPAAAKRLPIAAMTDMAMMSGDMPCCPDGQTNNKCQDCPLVAMCMLTVAQAEPSSTYGVPVSFQIRSLFFALDDLRADGLIRAPPDHPPRA
jgi:hypothetical protein